MRWLGLITCLFLLSNCGLRAVYNDSQLSTSSLLTSIEIEPIDSIEGAEFHHHLSTIFPTLGEPKYLLKVNFCSTDAPIAIQKNSDILRQTISQVVTYRLFEKSSGKEVTSGKFTHISSYNTIFSAYATYVESEMTLENLTKQAAEEIRTRLILYFEKVK